MVDHSYPGVYVEEFDAGAHPIAGVDTSTAGLVGVTDRGPVEAQLVTSWMDFTERFGDSVTPPEPAVRARWTLDGLDGGDWWHLGFAVKGFFDNGGQRLYVKRVVADDPASLCAADFVNTIDAFERFDAISIVLAPGIWSAQVQAALIAQCEARGSCFAVLDAPVAAHVEQVRTFRAQRHSRFAALYYPWVDVLDPRTAQRITVPASAHLFTLVAGVTTIAAFDVYHEVLVHPEQISAKFDNWFLALLAALTFAVATLGINVVANFVSPAFDFANVFPKVIDFKRGGYIAALIALVLYPFAPWESNAATFVNAIGATMGPLLGVILVDYYLIRRGEINVAALYQENGEFRFQNGWNLRAFVAAGIGALFSSVLPNLTSWLPSWWGIYGWFFGVAIAGAVYLGLQALTSGGAEAATAKEKKLVA